MQDQTTLERDFMWIRFICLDKKKKPQYLEIPLVIQPYWPQTYGTRTEALGEEVGDIREGEKKREGRGEKKKSVHTNNQHGLYLCREVFLFFPNIYRSQPRARRLRRIITSSHSRVVILLITSRCLSSHCPCESELLGKKKNSTLVYEWTERTERISKWRFLMMSPQDGRGKFRP